MSAVATFHSPLALSCDTPLQPALPRSVALDVQLYKRYRERGNVFELGVKFKLLPGLNILVGHSGAGKSTLLNCIAGLCDPDQGHIAIGQRILFDSTRRIRLGAARRNIGFVSQDLALFPHLTVEGNIAYGLRTLDAAERERRISAIAKSLQIAHLRKRSPREISGGEQQRVALARSLVTQPDVLLLDEPLSSLDIHTKSRVIEDLRSFNETRQIPILYVTHDHSEALALGERVFALEKGQIIREGSPLEVLATPRRETIADSAGFENLFDAKVVGMEEHEGLITCRLTGTAIELKMSSAPIAIGTEVRVGIRAHEVMLASARPQLISACNVLGGRVRRLDAIETGLEARITCGVDLRVHLPQRGVESCGLKSSEAVWVIVKADSCHLVRKSRPGVLQRLFVFVCNGNTSRSPIAQAICNAEIARRLKVPFEALATAGVHAVSAGLNTKSGEPMSRDASGALEQIGISDFNHLSQNLTAELVETAEAIFCMTKEQQEKAIKLFPSAAEKITCLNPGASLEAPEGHGSEAFVRLTQEIQSLVHARLDWLVGVA